MNTDFYEDVAAPQAYGTNSQFQFSCLYADKNEEVVDAGEAVIDEGEAVIDEGEAVIDEDEAVIKVEEDRES